MATETEGERKGPDIKLPDPVELSRAMAKIAERSQTLVTDFLTRQAAGRHVGMADPLNVGNAFLEMTARMISNPAKLMGAQVNLWRDYMTLWQTTTRRWLGAEADPVAQPAPEDRRFKDPSWEENQLFDFIKQSYLLTSRWITDTVRDVDGLDEKTAKKVDFYTRQFVDAMAPSNFVLTNPEVIRATVESSGENLVKGLSNLLGDLERGKGKLHIKMTDMEVFKLGDNIAVTPGKVVFQNDLIQLLQYAPTTTEVYKRPLLIVPPWINKFYILDLREKNSFIKWAVGEGHTVFVVSWVNPDEHLAAKTFEDYMFEGILAALGAVQKATGAEDVNVIGYCLGGTLLASTLAYMAAKGDARFKSATFFTTMVDFEEAGELGVFIDEEQLASLEAMMREKGYLEGSAMATTFNMLRANDLIWSFVVNNYLLGKDPFPFDLLYWNADSTRMPAAMHTFYLRKMYQENLLAVPGGIELGGVPIDLGKIALPTFILSTREDHIAPWKSTFSATRLYSGPVKFCLSASGHIAGVVNPPNAQKYCYWTNGKKASSPDEWLAGAEQHPGSWWTEWGKWIAKHGGPMVKARVPGEGALKAVEDAPGSYVRVKAGS
ncbi:MAG TPA: class I poly(R)-hydroxyalkanoic acid synthase [Alphaproteobacteria bacterium]|nr:class I poly(R)-hydroxyalkanoic acid synthase [Alphaproteobacteria bacterium]